MSGLAAIVLAAGKGKRFHSDLPKVLHRAAGVPLLHWVLGAVEGIGDVDRVLVVVGHGRETVAESVSDRFAGAELVDQPEQRGTADAVARCRAPLEGFTGEILVLPGDAPLVEAESLRMLVGEHRSRRAAVSLLTAVLPDPAGYGRITRGPDGTVRIVEHADASPEIRAIREVSTGIWCFDAGALFPALEGLSPDNAQGEYYLPDAAPVIQAGGGRMVTMSAGDPETVRGVNDRAQLAQAERALQARTGAEKGSAAPPMQPPCDRLDGGSGPGSGGTRTPRSGKRTGDGMEISTKKRAMIFSGTSNPELAQEIADHLGMRLGRVELSRFASGDIYARYLESVRGADCFVIQSHSNPVNEMIMEQLVMIDALKRASAKRVNAVIPFYGYSRQDRKALAREPISARLVANILQVAGADRVLSVDLHTGQIQGFFDVPVDHLTALPILAEYVGRKYPDELVVIAPDAGGVHLAEKFAHHLRAPVAFMQKRRRPDLRNVSETFDLVGEVEGKRCLIVDDMIDTGGTVSNAVGLLLSRGATSVVVAATHGVFSNNALERLQAAGFEELIVTNSIPVSTERHIPKLTVLSIGPIVAATIKAVFEDESVSEIFQGENQEYIPPDSLAQLD